METPELEKIQANRNESQSIGEFLDWLRNEQEIHLCKYKGECRTGDHSIYSWINLTTERWLAEYFDIDLDKAEKERRGLLDEIRAQNG